MAFAPALSPVGWIRTGLVSSKHCSHRTTVNHSPRPINFALASEPIQQREVNEIPDAGVLPVSEAPPARHPAATPQLLRQHLPRNAAAKDKDNARQTRSIRDARPSTLRASWRYRKKSFDEIP